MSREWAIRYARVLLRSTGLPASVVVPINKLTHNRSLIKPLFITIYQSPPFLLRSYNYFHRYAFLSSLATASAIHLPPSHSLSSFPSIPRQDSRLQSILRIRRPPTPLRHARLEAILELARHLLQTPHAACARRLSPLGFHAPVVCCRDSGLAAWVDFGAGRKEGRERMGEE